MVRVRAWLIIGICSCFFNAFSMKQDESVGTFPNDIYAAIRSENQQAIDHYISAGQVNKGEDVRIHGYAAVTAWDGEYHGEEMRIKVDPREIGGAVEYDCFSRLSCMLPCPIPLCCASGLSVKTPLYCALKQRKFAIARQLLMDSGAHLHTGEWQDVVTSTCFPCCCYVCGQDLKFISAATLLAQQAQRLADARELLRDAIAQDKPLLSGRETDADLCDDLINLHDADLLRTAVAKKLIQSEDLLVIALKKHRSFVLEDFHLIDDLLSHARPNWFEYFFEQVIVNDGPVELVMHLLKRNPRRELIRRRMHSVRGSLVIQKLRDYLSVVAEPVATIAPAAISPVASSVHDVTELRPAQDCMLSESSADNSCSLCSRRLKLVSCAHVRMLACGHSFHVQCIDEWLAKHYNCPNCRAVVK